MAGGSIFKLGNSIDVLLMTVCLCLVVVITICFEGVLQRLEWWIKNKASDITSHVYMEMLQKLYKELMILGFISFVLTLLLQTKSITNANQIACFEYAHFVVFFVALSLIAHAAAITFTADRLKRRCHKAQAYSLTELYQKTQESTFSSDMWFDVTFKLLTCMFVLTHELPVDLNFAGYYGMVQDSVVIDVLEIDISSWFLLIGFLFANVALQTTASAVKADLGNGVDDTNTTSRLLGATGSSSGPNMSLTAVIEFSLLGWVLVGLLILGIVLGRRRLHKVLRVIYLMVGHDSTEGFASALLSADKKMEEYQKKASMSKHDLKKALEHIGKEKKVLTEREAVEHSSLTHRMQEMKDGVTHGVKGAREGIVHKLADATHKIADATHSVTDHLQHATHVVADATHSVTDHLQHIVRKNSSGNPHYRQGSRSASRSGSGMMGVFSHRQVKENQISPVHSPKHSVKVAPIDVDSINEEHDAFKEVDEERDEFKEKPSSIDSAVGARKQSILGNLTFSGTIRMRQTVVAKGSKRRSSVFDALKTPLGSSRNAQSDEDKKKAEMAMVHSHVEMLKKGKTMIVSNRDLEFVQRFIDLLMLMNCSYIAIFICSFADPTPKLENGGLWAFLALLPALLNVVIFIPCIIFEFSLIRAACKLEHPLLGTVLEHAEQIQSLMTEVHTKIGMRLQEQNKTMDDLRSVFEEMDTDGQGTVSKKEFRTGLQRLNIFLSQAAFDRLFRSIDKDQSNELEFEEFCDVLFQTDDEEASKVQEIVEKDLEGKSDEDKERYLNSLFRSLAVTQTAYIRNKATTAGSPASKVRRPTRRQAPTSFEI